MKKMFMLFLFLSIIECSLYHLNVQYVDRLKIYLPNSYYIYKLMHYDYPRYIPIDDNLLTSIAQKKQLYDEDIQKIMTEDVYDTLYHKFQYEQPHYPLIYIKIIDQRIDKDDPRLVYIDFLLIQKINLSSINKYWTDYRFTFDQITALRDKDNNFKLIYYDVPTKYHGDRVFSSYWSNLEYSYANETNYKIFLELDKLNTAYEDNDYKKMYSHFSNIVGLLYYYRKYCQSY